MTVPLFHWTQVLLLCALMLLVGFVLAKQSKPKRPNYIKDTHAIAAATTPALEHLQSAFQSGQLGFSESLELAATYRRTGDLERAIAIHQSLYGRPGLSWQELQRAQFELAKDFFQAGILSRAEDLLESLIEQKGDLQLDTAQLLIRLYVQQKDWHKATDLFIQHLQYLDPSLHWVYANVLCEQAIIQMRTNPEQARQLIVMARQKHPNSIRPNVMLIHIAQQQKSWREWLNQVQLFLKEQPERIDLVKQSIMDAIHQSPDLDQKIITLLKSLSQQPQIRFFRAQLALRMQQSDESFELLKSIDLNWDTLLLRIKYLSRELNHPELIELDQKLQQFDQKRLRYQCSHCGYEALVHRWHCPQCERWETLQPTESELNQKLLL